MRARMKDNGSHTPMTPMIDIVFQMIIFFIVTVSFQERKNETIQLPPSPNASEMREEVPLILEVDRRGWISIHGAQWDSERLRSLLESRRQQRGAFPVVIRGDARAKHADIRNVMDICSDVGLRQVSFVGLKEKRR